MAGFSRPVARCQARRRFLARRGFPFVVSQDRPETWVLTTVLSTEAEKCSCGPRYLSLGRVPPKRHSLRVNVRVPRFAQA
jgi:hypothetical protein